MRGMTPILGQFESENIVEQTQKGWSPPAPAFTEYYNSDFAGK